MTTPAARVLALLELLQSGGTRTVKDLAARLAIDERTVRRYVVQLADLGIGVQSVRGRYGGYRLTPGYRMPPLMLTEDEAVAVLLGLITGRRTGWRPHRAPLPRAQQPSCNGSCRTRSEVGWTHSEHHSVYCR